MVTAISGLIVITAEPETLPTQFASLTDNKVNVPALDVLNVYGEVIIPVTLVVFVPSVYEILHGAEPVKATDTVAD